MNEKSLGQFAWASLWEKLGVPKTNNEWKILPPNIAQAWEASTIDVLDEYDRRLARQPSVETNKPSETSQSKPIDILAVTRQIAGS